MMAIVLIVLLIAFSFVLIKATNMLLSSLRQLSAVMGVDRYGLTAFLLALATSFPELFVGITAAVRGDPELSLGNIIGSNIANLSLVLGGAAVIAGVVKATDRFLTGEVFHTFLAGTLPLLLFLDGSLTRLDAVVLLMVYGLYSVTVLRAGRREIVEKEIKPEGGVVRRIWYKLHDEEVERWGGKLLIGVALLIFSADMIVRAAQSLAFLVNLPTLLIGMLVVAVGTSLPELSFGITAIRKNEAEMALGNILGSVVANSTLILGITALIRPIELENGLRAYLIATIGFIVIFLMFWTFLRSKKTLNRWEGLVLLIVYLLFIAFEFFRLKNGFTF